MRTTPRVDPATVSAADTAADPAAAAATMRSEGLLKVKGLVPSPEATAALVAHIEARLAEGRAVCKEDPVKEYQYFGGVLVRNNRYDLKLELEPPVEAVLLPALAQARRPPPPAPLGSAPRPRSTPSPP